ncbi:MAG TPA: thiol peroxidase, partial [Rectinemataceae bacterium]|nr:thiol peroxidase [Rectinemataceae bacterium]
MATVILGGTQVHSAGSLPALGSKAPDFRLTTAELKDVSLKDFGGKVKILNIVVSLDTGVCASSAVKFNREIKKVEGAVVLTISRDLPFAMGRFCKAEGVDVVVPLSELRGRDFGKAYGVEMVDGNLAGLLSRAIVVLDRNDKVVYTQQVPEIGIEPDYE